MPPRRKKVTTQTQTLAGEGGVAVIARRVNEMGYLWHDRIQGRRLVTTLAIRDPPPVDNRYSRSCFGSSA